VGLLNIIFFKRGLASFGLNLLFAIAYSIYILVDTQKLLGDKKKKIDMDDYILGAILIYTDIINLFMKLLKAMGEKKKK
jgi:hypothetical protein